MTSYLELAFAWLLFLSVPALATGMLYRAWKSGAATAPVDTAASRLRWSHFTAVNASCGLALYAVFAAVLVIGLPFATWSGLVAIIVWLYCLSLHILKRKNAGSSQQV